MTTDTAIDAAKTDEVIDDTAAQAAFGEGFEGTEDTAAKTPEAKKEPEKEPEKKAEAPAQAPAEEKPDPFKEVLGSLKSIDERLRRTEGRVGALQSAMDTAKRVSAAGGEAPTKTQVQDAAASSDKWNKLKEDFPDWADAVEERFAALPKSQPVDLEGLKRDIGNTFMTRIAESAQEAREYARLDRKHDGWEETIQTPEFEAFLYADGPVKEHEEVRRLRGEAKQRYADKDPAGGNELLRKAQEMEDAWPKQFPKWWGDRGHLANSTKAVDAIKLLDDFKEQTKAAPDMDPQKKTNRLAAAVTPKGLPQAGPTTESIEAAFAAGFNGSG